jgi:hypothetical protein
MLSKCPKVMSLNAGDDLHPKHTAIDFDDLANLRSCAVLCDDLMHINKTEFLQLKELLDRTARHNSVSPVILIAHAIARTGLFSLLTHLTEVHFTHDRGNCQAIALTCEAFKFGKEAKNQFIDRFLEAKEQYGIFILSKQKRTFVKQEPSSVGKIPKTVSSRQQLQEQQLMAMEPYKRSAEMYIPHVCQDAKRSLCIFQYILMKIPLTSLEASDLTISLQRKNCKSALSLSILDYLVVLDSPNERPSKLMSSLHKYIDRHVSLPKCMVRNKFLRLR